MISSDYQTLHHKFPTINLLKEVRYHLCYQIQKETTR